MTQAPRPQPGPPGIDGADPGRTRAHALALLLYALFFCTLFLQFPLKNALFGNYDSWVAFILWKSKLVQAASWLSGDFLGTFFYPARHVAWYGETLLASTMLFGALKLAGLSDLWACYGITCIIFTFNAWAVRLLAGNYVKSSLAAFFAGFAFACSNYYFASLDDNPILSVCLPVLCLHGILRFRATLNPRWLTCAGVLGGLQVHISVYYYVVQSLMVLLFGLMNFKVLVTRQNLRPLLTAGFWYVFIPLPLFIYYVYGRTHGDIYFPWPVHLVMDGTTLHFSSLFGVLSNNLLYPEADTSLIFWGHVRVMAFLGFGVWTLAFASLGEDPGKKAGLVALALAGIAFSFAFKSVTIKGEVFHLPFFFTEQESFFNFFRVPSRFFWMTSLAVSLMGAMGLEILGKRLPGKRAAALLALAAMALHFAENTPFPLRAYPYEPFGTIPREYKDFFAGKTHQVILDLPSTDIAIVPFSDDNLFGFNRELVYMNWQLAHRQHIINGVNSYVPSFRILFEKMVDDIFYAGNFQNFPDLAKYGLTHVVFHKDLVLEKDKGLEDRLRTAPFLQLELETSRTCIYRVIMLAGSSASPQP